MSYYIWCVVYVGMKGWMYACTRMYWFYLCTYALIVMRCNLINFKSMYLALWCLKCRYVSRICLGRGALGRAVAPVAYVEAHDVYLWVSFTSTTFLGFHSVSRSSLFRCRSMQNPVADMLGWTVRTTTQVNQSPQVPNAPIAYLPKALFFRCWRLTLFVFPSDDCSPFPHHCICYCA